MSDDLPERLAALGEQLEHAIAVQLSSVPARARGRRRPRRLVLIGAMLALAIPGAAIAAQQLLSTQQVAQSLPAGTRALIGTDPTCTVVTAGVEYHCTLASPPSSPAGSAPAASSPGASAPSGGAAIQLTRLKAKHGLFLVRSGGVCRAVLVKLVRGKVWLSVPRRIERMRDLCDIHLAPVAAGALPAGGATSATGASGSTAGATGSTVFDWTGTVEPTVDATKHVNGGCRALDAAGTSWECYIGQAAVSQNIISEGFLGQYAPVPGVG